MPTFISDSRGGTGRGQAAVTGRSVDADYSAAPLEQERVAPAPAHAPDPLAAAHLTESMPAMQGEGGGILGEDARLERPEAGGLRAVDERAQEPAAHAPAAGRGRNVHADFGDAAIDAS